MFNFRVGMSHACVVVAYWFVCWEFLIATADSDVTSWNVNFHCPSPFSSNVVVGKEKLVTIHEAVNVAKPKTHTINYTYDVLVKKIHMLSWEKKVSHNSWGSSWWCAKKPKTHTLWQAVLTFNHSPDINNYIFTSKKNSYSSSNNVNFWYQELHFY